MADTVFCAHYPFVSEARELVRSMGSGITAASVEGGEARITSLLRDGAIPSRASELEDDLKAEVLSYAASRAIMAHMQNRLVASRMAVGEAKRANSLLRSSYDSLHGFVEKVCAELGLHFIEDGGNFRIAVWEYLLYTPRSVDYKLSNRELSGGFVRVSAHQRIRIIEEAIRKKIEGTPLPPLKDAPQEIKDAASRIVKFLPKEEIAPTSIANEDFPPCIRKLLEDLRTSVNVPHNGRYALAIYLIRAGMTDEQIAKLFQNAPDFNLETTTYQVKYIRNKGYSMPSCSTMDTWGICIADCRCGTPINFRRRQHGPNAERTMVKNDG